MEYAIEITEQNKINNPVLFKLYAVGDYARFNKIPKSYNNGKKLSITYDLLTDEHVKDGFFPVVNPEYNPETETLLRDKITKGQNVFIVEKRDLSEAEIFNRKYPNKFLSQVQFRRMALAEFGINIRKDLIPFIESLPASKMSDALKNDVIDRILYSDEFYMLDESMTLLFPLLNTDPNKTINDLYQYFQDYAA